MDSIHLFSACHEKIWICRVCACVCRCVCLKVLDVIYVCLVVGSKTCPVIANPEDADIGPRKAELEAQLAFLGPPTLGQSGTCVFVWGNVVLVGLFQF